MAILIPITDVGLNAHKNEFHHFKKYISTQLDTYIPEKFRKNHTLFTKFVEYFIQFIEEYSEISSVVWDIGTTYAMNDVVSYSGNYYRARINTVGERPDLYTDSWEQTGNYTFGAYEHMLNIANYINVDFIDSEDSDFTSLYDDITTQMAETLMKNQQVYSDVSNYHVADMINMIKRFNTEKITNISFTRLISYLKQQNPSANITFGETLAELLAELSWDVATTYSSGEKVVYSGRSYVSAQDSNTGNTPDVSPLWWNDLGEYVGCDPDFLVPMEYGERFVYWINTDDFRLNSLINNVHPTGWLREVLYHPVTAEAEIEITTTAVAGMGAGIITGSFDYSTV